MAPPARPHVSHAARLQSHAAGALLHPTPAVAHFDALGAREGGLSWTTSRRFVLSVIRRASPFPLPPTLLPYRRPSTTGSAASRGSSTTSGSTKSRERGNCVPAREFYAPIPPTHACVASRSSPTVHTHAGLVHLASSRDAASHPSQTYPNLPCRYAHHNLDNSKHDLMVLLSIQRKQKDPNPG